WRRAHPRLTWMKTDSSGLEFNSYLEGKQTGTIVSTPTASFIPAQGNALGSLVKHDAGALKARFIGPPVGGDMENMDEAGRWPATNKLIGDEPRALPWAGMSQAFGLIPSPSN